MDNLSIHCPMAHVQTIYYLDVDLYHYYIGQEDQSVHEAVMIRRLDQQIRVNLLMLQSVDLKGLKNPIQRQYLLHYLEIITIVSNILALRSATAVDLAKRDKLWQDIQAIDPMIYQELRNGIMGRLLHLPGVAGKAIPVNIYKVTQKLYGFN